MSTHEHRPTNEAVHKLCGDVFIAGTEVPKVQGLYGAGQDFIKDSFSGNVRGMGPAVAELGSALLGIAGVAAMAMQIVFSLFFFYESPAEIPILMMFPAGMLLISLMLLRAGLRASGTMASIGAAPIAR